MDIKVIDVINDKEEFEKEVKEYLEKGYKVLASNFSNAKFTNKGWRK